jgi:NitT/TauT family transport system substrate-binding protein
MRFSTLGFSSMNRRRLLQGALASSGALLGIAGTLRSSSATSEPATRVRLGFVGNPCEAITYAAPGSAIFAKHALAPSLVGFDTERDVIAALGAGRIDAASMNLPALLRPLESGSDVRLTAALHYGCLRIVAPEAFVVSSVGNLKGARIATDRLHSPSMNLLSALLRRQGLDPQHDVAWHVYPLTGLEAALDAKTVDCVAASDPLGYVLILDKKAEPYIDSADGGFSCGGTAIAHGHHCFLAVNGGLVEQRPALAAALTRAYLDTSNAFLKSVGPGAVAEVKGGYSEADVYHTIDLLQSYDWHASTDLVVEEIELTARDFRRAGLLERGTDPERLAERAYANVLNV